MANATATEDTSTPLVSVELFKRDVLRFWWKQIQKQPGHLLEPSGVEAAVKLLSFLLAPEEKPLPGDGDKATIEAVQEKLNFIETLLEAKGIHITEAPGRAPRTHG